MSHQEKEARNVSESSLRDEQLVQSDGSLSDDDAKRIR